MKVSIHILATALLLILVVAQAHAAPPATEGAAATTSVAQWGQRSVIITWNGSFDRDPFIERFRKQFLESAQKQLNIPQQELPRRATVQVGQVIAGGETGTSLVLRVRIEDSTGVTREKVEKFIQEQVELLQKQVPDAVREYREKRIAAAKQEEAAHETRIQQITDKIKSLRVLMQDTTGQIDVSHAALAGAATKTQELYQQLDLDHHAKEARKAALEDAIARLTREVTDKVKDDAVANELQKVVEAREKKIDRYKELVSRNAASKTELEEHIGEVAEARAKLFERKRQAAAEAGGNLIEQLNKDLLMLSIDSAEQNTRYEILQKRRQQLRQGLDVAEQVQALEQERIDLVNRRGSEGLFGHGSSRVEGKPEVDTNDRFGVVEEEQKN